MHIISAAPLAIQEFPTPNDAIFLFWAILFNYLLFWYFTWLCLAGSSNVNEKPMKAMFNVTSSAQITFSCSFMIAHDKFMSFKIFYDRIINLNMLRSFHFTSTRPFPNVLLHWRFGKLQLNCWNYRFHVWNILMIFFSFCVWLLPNESC